MNDGQFRYSATASRRSFTRDDRSVVVRIVALSAMMVALKFSLVGGTVHAEDDLTVEQVATALQIASQSMKQAKANLVNGDQLLDADPGTDSMRKVNESLHKVSTDAVARGLQFGPPVRSESENSSPLIFRSVVVDTSRRIPLTRIEAFERQLPEQLYQLSWKWWSQNVEPDLAYNAFRICVNPPAKPDRLFLYATEATNTRFPSLSNPQSAVHELVRWAVKANRTEDLKNSLDDQQLDAVAEGCFIYLLLAIENQNEPQIRKRCIQLNRFVERATDPSLLRLLAGTLMKCQQPIKTLEEVETLLLVSSEKLLAVDGQNVAQSNFAVTAAVDGFRGQVSRDLRRNPTGETSAELGQIANRLLTRNSLPPSQQQEFQAAIADEFVIAEVLEAEFAEPLKSEIAERLVRFPVGRRVHQIASVGEVNGRPSDADQRESAIAVNWNPGHSPDPDDIWIQLRDFDAADFDATSAAFTISGLETVGSPSTNVDGTVIAFHGRTASRPPGSGNHVYVVDRDRHTMIDLGPAVNPSLTPSGRRLTCSRYTPHKGVWIVRSDGSNWKLIQESGWASKFGTGGTNVGFTVTDGKSTMIRIFDLSSNCFQPETTDGISATRVAATSRLVQGWPFAWASSPSDGDRAMFWWYDSSKSELQKYPVPSPMQDKYQLSQKIVVESPPIRDLCCLNGDRLAWLSPSTSGSKELKVWRTNQPDLLEMKGREILGLTAIGSKTLVVFHRKQSR